MRKIYLRCSVMLLVFAVMMSCGSSRNTDQFKLLCGPIWVLHSMKGTDVTVANFIGGKPSLNFDTSLDVSGTNGCNRLSGKFKPNGDSVRFYGFSSTRMMCPDEISGKLESLLLTVTHYKIKGSSLKLYSGGTELFSFKAEVSSIRKD